MKAHFAIPSPRSARIAEIAFLVFICTVTALCRWKFVVYPWVLNPDEVQAGANVLRFMSDGLGWNSLDGTTVGPLNTAILAWPYLLGMDVTLSTIRLTALIILCLVLCITYLTMRKIGNKAYAMTLVVLLAAFYSLTASPDFQHYSSELASVLLISGAVFLCFHCFHDSSAGPAVPAILAIGLLLGSVPYAKIQAAPIALTIALFALYFIDRDKNVSSKPKRIALFIFSGLLPTVLILGPQLVGGGFSHFWNSYIVWPTLYVKAPLTLERFHALVASEPLLSCLFLLPLLLITILLACFGHKVRRDPHSLAWGLFLASILASSWFSIIRPGNMYPHYLMFLPAPFLLLMAFALNKITPQKGVARAYYACYFATLALMIFSMASAEDKLHHGPDQKFQARSPRLFDYLGAQAGDKMLVWGWMPEWHVSSGLAPAARESMNNNQIVDSRLQGYFRERLLADLAASRPALVIDSVGGRSFRFTSEPDEGLHAFDALSRFVSSRYTRVQGVYTNPACARTYMRNDRAAQFGSTVVRLKTVSASASLSANYGAGNIDDFSVTEDTCSDYWLLPDNTPGYVEMKFHGPEPVHQILVLNTANSHFLDRGTARVEIALFDKDKAVKRVQARVEPYPRWTRITLEKPVVSDAMRLSVLAWTGSGGGINEVKILK